MGEGVRREMLRKKSVTGECGRARPAVHRRSWSAQAVPVLFIIGGFGLYVLLAVVFPRAGPVSEDGRILRSSYGGDDRQYQVLVEGLEAEEQELPLTVTVSPRRYTEQEAERVFEAIMGRMEEIIRGGNPSLMEVTTDLILPSWLEQEGVRLRWYSSDPEIISADGQVSMAVEEMQNMTLYVQLSDGIHKADYEVPVRVVMQERTNQQRLLDGLSAVIQTQDKMQQETEYLDLPLVYEGRPIAYRTENESDYAVLPVLGVLLAAIWPMRKQAGQRKKEKQREQELLLDYAELVSKLIVFIGAGMTARNAWARMVKDYEAGLEQGKQRKRAAYEEMRQTSYQMLNGMSESSAYQEFGRRCRLQPYLKLSSLLEQNRKAGNKNLRIILETELADAFELRKNLARRMGEEAGTKLLLPLFLMLGIVMVMIMVPAMMTMG